MLNPLTALLTFKRVPPTEGLFSRYLRTSTRSHLPGPLLVSHRFIVIDFNFSRRYKRRADPWRLLTTASSALALSSRSGVLEPLPDEGSSTRNRSSLAPSRPPRTRSWERSSGEERRVEGGSDVFPRPYVAITTSMTGQAISSSWEGGASTERSPGAGRASLRTRC